MHSIRTRHSLMQLLLLLLLLLLAVFLPVQSHAAGNPSSSGTWAPEEGASLDYRFSGGTLESVSDESTARNLLMTGTVRPGETVSISCTGTTTLQDTLTTTIKTTIVMAYIETSPRVKTDSYKEAEEKKEFEKAGSASASASYTVPDNVERITVGAYVRPSWFNPNGKYSAAYYVQATYTVLKEDAPVETAKQEETTEAPSITVESTPPSGERSITAMFSDLYGEVSVRPNDADDDAYEFAELDMLLYHNDRIRTKTKSGAIISFSDLSTFVMKPDTIIVLDMRVEKESKVDLIIGNLLVNIEKIIKDGNVDVEMTQAVAGIKGTTLVCEESEGKSTLKVLEGSVELTSDQGERIVVHGGEMVSATNGEIGKVTKFSPTKELGTWSEKAQDDIQQALRNKGVSLEGDRSTSGRTVAILIGFIVAGLLLLLVVILSANRRGMRPSAQAGSGTVHVAATHASTRYCGRCGQAHAQDIRFCTKCGAPMP